jgi:hypothetical protein
MIAERIGVTVFVALMVYALFLDGLRVVSRIALGILAA